MDTENLDPRARAERQIERASYAAYVLGLLNLLLAGMNISAATLEGWPAVVAVVSGVVIWILGYGVSCGSRLAAVLLALFLLQGVATNVAAGRVVGGLIGGFIFGYFILQGVPGSFALRELRLKEGASTTPSEEAAV